MLLIVLVVIFVMSMFLWLLALLAASPQLAAKEGWLAWFACLILGIVVFLIGSGAAHWGNP